MSAAVPIFNFPARHRPWTVLLPGLAGAVLLLLFLPLPRARAVVLPAQTIDGPSEDIVGFGGVAMAEDGSGGLVYLKRVDGVAHVFVSRYLGGHWMTPIRVDTEEPYAASWPRIGAAAGGELVVVWATPFATEKQHPVQELLGATMGPGGESFGQAMIVDPDIREGTGTNPDLAMSSTGQADVVYRVVAFQGSIPLLRPSDVVESVRVAHFDGRRWARLGAINRDPGVSMRPPTQANAPQIAIGPTGNGVVVWQEPEITGVARIWARRLFGETLGYVMPVSAESFGGAPIGQDADAPTVAVSRLGQADVAYRQSIGPGSPLAGPRIFLNILPNGESSSGAEFRGASVADPAVSGGKSASIGQPSVDIDEKEDVRLLYDANGTPRVIEGNDHGLSGTLSLGPPFAGSELSKAEDLSSASVMNPAGGGISAWPSEYSTGHPAVAVREDFSGGAVQTGLISGGAGGPIGELAVGRSGLGDGLVAFQQGPLGNAAIVAAQVTAPPTGFIVNVPKEWVKPSQARISWEPVISANGPLGYTVVLDGHRLVTPAAASTFVFNPRGLGDGVHKVQLLATDISGQAALSSPSPLMIDGQPPAVRVTRASGGNSVTIRVRDAKSGVDVKAVSVSFGDGQRARGRSVFHHHYHHPGIYRVVVWVRDKLGNAGVIHELVSVR
ncbi:MAG TPA: PKD domain-containing protein [Solirubrobacteraceae bacterium]|nr:PKD domain-containing protein [Solirubrobacteraceae bacterium]